MLMLSDPNAQIAKKRQASGKSQEKEEEKEKEEKKTNFDFKGCAVAGSQKCFLLLP